MSMSANLHVEAGADAAKAVRIHGDEFGPPFTTLRIYATDVAYPEVCILYPAAVPHALVEAVAAAHNAALAAARAAAQEEAA